jgi:hypothetical protein
MRKKIFSRFAPRSRASLCSSFVRMRKKKFPRFAPRARVLVVFAICQNEENFFRASRLVLASSLRMSSVRMRYFFFFALRASCSFPRFEPRVRFFVVHIICQTEDIVFFLRFAPRARAFAVQTLLMEYAFFRFSSFFFFAFAFFQIRADQK